MSPQLATLLRTWDRVSIYLPVILMGLMALATYWLARNTPSFNLPGTERVLTHEPDYFMRKFSVRSFEPTGRMKSEVHGSEARHFPDTDTFEIDQPRMRAVNADGVVTVATARMAISNADSSEVQLVGDAVVTREPPPDNPQGERVEVRGDFLHVFVQTERVRSHKPVILRRGDNQFTADSMDYDNLERVIELQGRVRGIIAPRGAPPQ
jgi:lipopolysaccharide export system protein LptC